MRLEVPFGVPGSDAIDVQASSENFPVALRVLPRSYRRDLLAVYRFARLTDDIGDEFDGDRLAALDWLELELDAAAEGTAQHPVLTGLTPTIRLRRLDLAPFRDLIEANRVDQVRTRYDTFDDLLSYCRLSANPVGRIVLAVFGIGDPELTQLSDDVCSGLQVVEHLQDVAEDLEADRVYLPIADMHRTGVETDDLRSPVAGPAVRSLIALESRRARGLLASGSRLTSQLPTWPRLAISGFTAGGLAALDAIGAVDHDVLAHRCRGSRSRVAVHATRTFFGRAPVIAEPTP